MIISNLDDINKLIESVKIETKNYGTICIFTNGNDWYIPTLINNLLVSFGVHDTNYKIAVFCSDKSGYDKCKNLNFKYFEYINIPDLKTSNILSGSNAGTDNYTKLCFVKTVIIRHILELGYTPVYLDPDMALLKPCIDHLLNYLNKWDFVCAEVLKTNIMLVKPTQKNKNLFDLNIDNVNYIINNENLYSDEDFLMIKDGTNLLKNYHFLDIDHYPDGTRAHKYKHVAKIIHANCVSGLENKIKLLKECDAWYI